MDSHSRRLLVSKLGRWRKENRNGLFHFDNIHDEDNVKEIRRQTRFLYFLILGSWGEESLAALGAPSESDEQGEPDFNEESFSRWFEDGLAPLASRQWVLDDAETIALYYCIDRDWRRADRRGDGANRGRHWEMRLEVRGSEADELLAKQSSLHAAREAYRWVSDGEGVLKDAARARLLASRILSESSLFERKGELPNLRLLDLDAEASRTVEADPEAFPSNSFKSRRINGQHTQ